MGERAGREIGTKAPNRRADYRLGGVYSLITSALLATQEPFSALAARHFSSPQFLCLTQVSLLLSVPLLTLPAASRRDLFALLFDIRNLGKLLVLFVVGLCGLLLYNVGLSSAQPIVTAAILNLSPFWAALVAIVLFKKRFPVSPVIFLGCFAVAFLGAMVVAWSQVGMPDQKLWGDILKTLFKNRWAYAIPIPIFFALSGALVGRWFGDFDESAAIAANFIVAGVCLIPATLILMAVGSGLHPHPALGRQDLAAALLLMIGTLAASAAGRVYYQVALTTTRHDNGFVTMFFLLIPVFSSLITIPLSWWIPDLKFVVGPMFFLGMALIAAPLFLFLLKSWQSKD